MFKSLGTTNIVVQVLIVTIVLFADEFIGTNNNSSNQIAARPLASLYKLLNLNLENLNQNHRRPLFVSCAHVEELADSQTAHAHLFDQHLTQSIGSQDAHNHGPQGPTGISSNVTGAKLSGALGTPSQLPPPSAAAAASPLAEGEINETRYELAYLKGGDNLANRQQRYTSEPDKATSSSYQTVLGQHSPTKGNLDRLIGTAVKNSTLLTADRNVIGRPRRLATMAAEQELNPDCEFQGSKKPAIFGLRCDDSEVTEDGTIIIKAFSPTRVYVIGRNLYSNLTIALTEQDGATHDDCTHADRIKSLRLFNISMNIGEIIVELPPPEKSVPYYLCIREDTQESRWYHQGSDAWLRIHVKQDFMPLWAKIITIVVLLSMSGLFSGLNLGLMALDKNELQVIMKCGTDDEKRYATAIEPVRRRGNYLLCSILFSNTLVNSTISVFLEDLSSGMVAIVMSTVLIVLFGEILPQAFCSRHGLAVGARTIWLTQFCMVITFPLSYPVSYCLDLALGEEIGHAYDRERLMEFIQVTRDYNNLETDEVNIIAGALKIKRVQVCEVMTRIEDVYMLDENSVLDFDTIQAIVGKGYSRIPVHEAGDRRNIKAVLFAKDLALVDPDDRTPVQTMIGFYNHPRMFVYEDTTLDQVLNEFKKGTSHMAFVQRIVDDGERDPYLDVVGIVTLEDVIEEIMQMEINDETDILSDNRRKRRRKDAQIRKDFSQFTNLGTGDSSFNVVTPQLCLAAYQYLATTVEPFTPKYLSDNILKRLMSQKIFYKVRLEDDPALKRLYTSGEPADYFIMILEGRVHVVCGKENLVFDGGPFSFFGKAALSQVDPIGGDSLTVITASNSAVVPVGPAPSGGDTPALGGQTLTTDSGESSKVGRKESTKPILSRRTSLASIMTSQISLSNKTKQSSKQQTAVEQDAGTTELSPTGSGGKVETVELVERGSYYFKPDYTVDIIANTSYLKVTRNDYITALKATALELEEGDNQNSQQQQ